MECVGVKVNMIDQRYTGKAGEYRVMSELLLREFNPSLVTIDSGIDIILAGSNLKIQVKTGRLRDDGRNKDYLRYTFETRKSYYVNGKKDQKRELTFRTYKEQVDFIICFGITDDSFYIIPIKEIPNGPISVYPYRENKVNSGPASKYQKYLNAWDLLDRE